MITIHQSPATISPAYNPLDFVISSTNSAEDNHKYIVDVKSGATLLKRIKQPATQDELLRFDASRIVSDYVTHDIGGITFEENTNSFKEYFIEVSEEYYTAGVLTTSAVLATSATLYAFNACYDFLDFIDYNLPVLNGSGASFLTNAPSTQKIHPEEQAWLYGANTGNVTHAEVKTYDGTGLVETFDVTNGSPTDKFFRFPSGTDNLPIDPGIVRYTIQAFDDATPVSKVMTYEVQDLCQYENWRLHFLNKKGGFDAFNFTLVSKHNQEINRSKFKKTLGTLSGTSYAYSKAAFGEVNYHTEVKDRFTINSDWLTEEEAGWLAELIASPVVFRELDGELIALSVDQNSYELKKKTYERMIQIELPVSYTHSNTRQRG